MEKTESEAKYGDIIGLSHPVSQVHPQMSVHERAAQFSPFAALTGHEAAIRETARLTEGQIELEEDRKEELDEKLSGLLQPGSVCPEVTVCYFEPDARKEGGAYRTVRGMVPVRAFKLSLGVCATESTSSTLPNSSVNSL